MKYLIVLLLSVCPVAFTTSDEITINDEVQPGQLIADLSSKTVFFHETPDAQSEFRLVSSGNFMNYLQIEPRTGKLFSKKKIDRDNLCAEIELCCKNEKVCITSISVAMMMKSPRNFEPTIRSLIINIVDINDHKPVFPSPYLNLSIPESTTVSATFVIPMANDKDSDVYSVKSYKLMSDNADGTFSLESRISDNKITASLRLKERLDRENVESYTLTIIAIDGGTPPLTGSLTVCITVLDINDNPPVFENTRQVISIKESQISKDPIAKVLATDRDSGENAEIRYSLDTSLLNNENKNLFRVEESTGEIFLNSALDYEKQKSHVLIILAANRVSTIGIATSTLSISVINVNDEKPVIVIDYLSSSRQHAVVTENTPASVFVAIISITDKDIGDAGKVSCRLDNFNDLFELRQSGTNQFKVYTIQSLDRETKARYSIKIICHDQGSPSQISDEIITVLVLDENDNTPEIYSPTVMRIMENKPSRTIVAKIHAVDKDEGTNGLLTYAISDTQNHILSFIDIDKNTGVIRTTQPIDRESRNPPWSNIDFTLTVSDSGNPSKSVVKVMQLVIEDENDNPPYFSHSIQTFNVMENDVAFMRLGQIEVTDQDEVGELRLSISYNKVHYYHCPFKLNKEKDRYWLSTTESLDWEKQSLHELIIVATDGSGYKSHTSSATVTVSVIDSNDNAPTFTFPRPGNNTTHPVSFRQQPGFVILTVSATDKDNYATGNGKFHFNLVDPHSLFDIDAIRGQIRIQKQLSESNMGEYFLTIKVEDQGSPSLSSTMQIKVRITNSEIHFTDKNQNSGNSKYEPNDYRFGIFSDKESILIFGLVLMLLVFLLFLCFIVYFRHMRGWFIFFPDFISLCRQKRDDESPKSLGNKENVAFNRGNTLTKIESPTTYTNRRLMIAPQQNYFPPDPLVKNSRDYYEILGQNLPNDTIQSPVHLIQGNSYSDLITPAMLPTFQEGYLTLNKYSSSLSISKDAPNFITKCKPTNQANINSSWVNNAPPAPIAIPDPQIGPVVSSVKTSYAVSYPKEQSTFV